jgi:tetraacyldisaccharide 4'-kinase
MQSRFASWAERTLFVPQGIFSHVVVFLLLPLSFLYGALLWLRRVLAKPRDFGIAIISVGNLTIGGNGKTPFIITLCKEFDRVCIISRGYGRSTQGMQIVSKSAEIFCSVEEASDEAYLLATMCPNADVIVSADRDEAIQKAKDLGHTLVILDDGFSKVGIKKLDILLHSIQTPTYPFVLPSGSYREFPFCKKYADINLYEQEDFFRSVTTPMVQEDLVLITSIAKPMRLDRYLPQNVVAKYYFADHYMFGYDEVEAISKKHPQALILCTQKDAVKLKATGFDVVVLELEIIICDAVIKEIKNSIFITKAS